MAVGWIQSAKYKIVDHGPCECISYTNLISSYNIFYKGGLCNVLVCSDLLGLVTEIDHLSQVAPLVTVGMLKLR